MPKEKPAWSSKTTACRYAMLYADHPATRNPQPATRNPQLATRNPNNQSNQLN
jgi:hypothetical protein